MNTIATMPDEELIAELDALLEALVDKVSVEEEQVSEEESEMVRLLQNL